MSWAHSNPENITENILSGFWYFESTSSLCLDYTDMFLKMAVSLITN